MSSPVRVALVTGGASGIGRASALAFADVGAQVVVADVDETGGGETVSLIEAAGGEAIFVPTDVTEDAQVEALVAGAVARFGRLDWALNNAGTTGAGGFTADYDVEDWRRTIALNLTSVFLCLRHEIRVMAAAGGGAIVNMASGAGLRGFPGLPAYVASKHGVVGLTRASALEYGSQGVRINAVCPGSTRTPMLEGYMGGDPKIEKMMTRSVPLGRLGRPDEIAAAVVWLCSDAASFVNGHALAADGGATA
ncbi:MAG TPA: glucose 1-dehydrogenase [Acidimicrobiia bacterium]|nr:glucose 1-dehydrogenase [Acidimicrobiia bacterium]